MLRDDSVSQNLSWGSASMFYNESASARAQQQGLLTVPSEKWVTENRDVFKRLPFDSDRTGDMFGRQESLVCQWLALEKHPDAFRVVSNFHCGSGQDITFCGKTAASAGQFNVCLQFFSRFRT